MLQEACGISALIANQVTVTSFVLVIQLHFIQTARTQSQLLYQHTCQQLTNVTGSTEYVSHGSQQDFQMPDLASWEITASPVAQAAKFVHMNSRSMRQCFSSQQAGPTLRYQTSCHDNETGP